jgi:hypothetical protein
VLVGLAVVVAEQVQHAVGGEQVQLVGGGVTGLLRLPLGHLRAQHDVAEHRGRGVVVLLTAAGVRHAPRAAQVELVHGEGHDVGGARLVHVLHVQPLHLLDVLERDGQLGQRRDAHAVEHVPRDVDQRALVDLGAALVEHLDAHRDRRLSSRRPGARCGPRPRSLSASYCA